MNTTFQQYELPIEKLKKLGLYEHGKFKIKEEDITALLAGRKTDLLRINNLKSEGWMIENVDAKLSLIKEPDGSVGIKITPIYKNAIDHHLLTEDESKRLKNGEDYCIYKTVGKGPNKKMLVIEYDQDTREFVSYDPKNVVVPHQINNQTLSKKQMEDLRNGKIIELSDGTKIQHRASESRGLISDKAALILSVMVDGGLSYLLVTGIRNLLNSREPQKQHRTIGFDEASKLMNENHAQAYKSNVDPNNEYSRGYGKGVSR
jgi:hypothetical protein